MARWQHFPEWAFRHRDFVRAPLSARAVFHAMWSCCDRWGRGDADPMVMRREIGHFGTECPREMVEHFVPSLVRLYSKDGVEFWELVDYGKDGPTDTTRNRHPSSFPGPGDDGCVATITDASRQTETRRDNHGRVATITDASRQTETRRDNHGRVATITDASRQTETRRDDTGNGSGGGLGGGFTGASAVVATITDASRRVATTTSSHARAEQEQEQETESPSSLRDLPPRAPARVTFYERSEETPETTERADAPAADPFGSGGRAPEHPGPRTARPVEVRVPAYTQRHEPPKGMSGMPRTNTTHLDRFADHFLADEIKPPHKPTPEELAEQAAAEERKAAELMAQWHEKRRKSGIEPPLAAEEAT